MSGNNGDSSLSRQERLGEILADLMRSVDAGESIDAEEWLSRHPEFEVELGEFFEQNERVEKLVRPLRHAAGKALNVRCPHCHNPIELLDEAPLTDISCPSCGSRFNLVSEKTVSHYGPGDKTIGHFQLLDRVGVGQFGSVWKARDTKLDRTVAVKIPRHAQLEGSQAELFLRDARAAAQLKHPNIVGVHEVGKHDDTIYIVSDFIHGATLKEWLAAKSLTPREAAELCVKIAKALHHAHEAGVIHRDLKPGNIMMDTDSEPHIVDFGLAKREAGEITMTVEGQILGTPAYMSPEQARGEGHIVDPRADIYSLGVILFELLTGELPFRGDKQMLLVQILGDEPPSPRILNSNVPRDLETVCLKCLEKDSSKRYLTAQQVANELRRWLDGKSIHARPPGATERVVKWAKRKPAVAALVVMSSLAMLFCVGMVVNFLNRSQAEATNQRLKQAIVEVNTANAELEAAVAAENEANEKLDKAVKTANESRQTADQLRRLADQYFYISQIKLAEIALSEGRTRNAWAALERFIPSANDNQDVRGIEWYYHWHKCRGQQLTLRGNGSDVLSLAYSPQGALLATSDTDGAVMVWNAAGGNPLSEFELGSNKCVHLTFAPDGKSVYCLQDNGVVSHWDLTGERRSDLDITASNVVAGVIASRSGVVVTQSTPFAKPVVHRPNSQLEGFVVLTGMPNDGSRGGSSPWNKEEVVFSINRVGTLLAVGTNHREGNVVLHDVSATVDPITLTFHGPVGCIAISKDGRLVAIGEGLPRRPANKDKDDYRMSIWNAQTKSIITEWTYESPFTHVAFSPDGVSLAVASRDRIIRTWDVTSLETSLAKRDDQSRTILPWELDELSTFYSQSDIRQFEFSANGDRLAVADRSGPVRIWDVQSGAGSTMDPIKKYTVDSGKTIGEVSFLARGKDVVVRSVESLHVVDVLSGEVRGIGDIEGEKWFGGRPDGGRLAISPDYSFVTDGKQVFRLPVTGLVHELNDDSPPLMDVAVNSTGEYIATAQAFSRPHGGDPGASVHDVRTGETLQHFDTPRHEPPAPFGKWWCSAVAFGANSTLITGTASVPFASRPHHVDIWSLQTGQHVRTLARTQHSIWRLRLSPDATKLAAATGNFDRSYLNEILIWDVATSRLLHSLRGHKECVYDVDFSADGTRLASVAGNRRARSSSIGELFVWDVMTGEEMLSIDTEDGGLLCVDFDNTGRQIVAGSAGGSITVLRPQW